MLAFLTRRTETPMPDTAATHTSTSQTPWPDGVIARYLTVAAATVDLRPQPRNEKTHAYADCTGCGLHIHWARTEYVREYAQEHAEKCRALPRPTA
jgi:hypothetical protein